MNFPTDTLFFGLVKMSMDAKTRVDWNITFPMEILFRISRISFTASLSILFNPNHHSIESTMMCIFLRLLSVYIYPSLKISIPRTVTQNTQLFLKTFTFVGKLRYSKTAAVGLFFFLPEISCQVCKIGTLY